MLVGTHRDDPVLLLYLLFLSLLLIPSLISLYLSFPTHLSIPHPSIPPPFLSLWAQELSTLLLSFNLCSTATVQRALPDHLRSPACPVSAARRSQPLGLLLGCSRGASPPPTSCCCCCCCWPCVSVCVEYSESPGPLPPVQVRMSQCVLVCMEPHNLMTVSIFLEPQAENQNLGFIHLRLSKVLAQQHSPVLVCNLHRWSSVQVVDIFCLNTKLLTGSEGLAVMILLRCCRSCCGSSLCVNIHLIISLIQVDEMNGILIDYWSRLNCLIVILIFLPFILWLLKHFGGSYVDKTMFKMALITIQNWKKNLRMLWKSKVVLQILWLKCYKKMQLSCNWFLALKSK